jgi:hypothetical protein
MLAALLLALCALAGFPAGASGVNSGVNSGPNEEPLAARGKNGLSVGRATLEATLLDRFGYSETGRELLDLFLKARLLDSLAAQRGVQVQDGEVTRRWQELDKRSRASGQALKDEIVRRNLTPEQFREFLRLALVQEKLARAALGLAAAAEVSGDQQEIWLQQEIGARGLELLPPAEGIQGVLARCGEIAVTRAEFATFLSARLPREDVRESAWHLLMLQAIEKRMPDLAPEARARAIEEEIARRRAKHALEYPTITFEPRLGATGRTLDSVRRDPSVAIAALSRLWVDRSAGPAGIRSAFEKEREAFEARYGEAVRALLLFRVAGRFVNDLCPRSFEQAEEELSRVAERLHTRAEFVQQVALLSEETNTKKQQGDLGWVTRGDVRVPKELREALFHLLDTGGTIPEEGRLLGPVRLDSGVALVWAGARRASPSWEEMSERVHEELRRRFLEDLMPVESVELLQPNG